MVLGITIVLQIETDFHSILMKVINDDKFIALGRKHEYQR